MRFNVVRLGRLFETDILLETNTFLVFALILAFQSGFRPAAMLSWLLVLIPLYTIVLIHEFGHLTMGRVFGYKKPKILLTPMGGIAMGDFMIEHHWERLLVVLAGPAVNVVFLLIGLAYSEIMIQTHSFVMRDLIWALDGLLIKVYYVNLGLLVFNMIPAFPLDGGQALRDGLAIAIDFRKATRIATTLGMVLAAAGGLLAFSNRNWWQLILAIMIYQASSSELRRVSGGDYDA